MADIIRFDIEQIETAMNVLTSLANLAHDSGDRDSASALDGVWNRLQEVRDAKRFGDAFTWTPMSVSRKVSAPPAMLTGREIAHIACGIQEVA